MAAILSSSKASSGLHIAFPDVCKTPGSTILVPIPYPNVAKTALAAQKHKKTAPGKKIVMKKSGISTTQGEEAGVRKGVISSKNMETMQLKSMLNQLNTKLQGLKSNDPNEWQKVILEYVVAAGALFVTTHNA